MEICGFTDFVESTHKKFQPYSFDSCQVINIYTPAIGTLQEQFVCYFYVNTKQRKVTHFQFFLKGIDWIRGEARNFTIVSGYHMAHSAPPPNHPGQKKALYKAFNLRT